MTDNHVTALNLARDGHWHQAHELVQDGSDRLSCLIHAWLHRQEGDLANAAYWYRRAGTKLPDNTLEEELDRLYRLVQAE